MNPEPHPREIDTPTNSQKDQKQQEGQPEPVQLSRKLLQRFNRTEIPYLNLVNLLIKEQQPENEQQYCSCIGYLQALALSTVNEGSKAKDFMEECYKGRALRQKHCELIEYFKFHKNFGLVVDSQIERLMRDHYQLKRKHQYIKIKKMLKDQHNISIKSIQNSSSSLFTPSRSQYSNLFTHHSIASSHLSSETQQLQTVCSSIPSKVPPKTKTGTLKIKVKRFEQDKKLSKLLQEVKKQQVKKGPSRSGQSVRSNIKITFKKPHSLSRKRTVKPKTVEKEDTLFSSSTLLNIKLSVTSKISLREREQKGAVKKKSKGVSCGSLEEVRKKSLHRIKSNIFCPQTDSGDMEVKKMLSSGEGSYWWDKRKSAESGQGGEREREREREVLFRKLRLSK